MKCRKLKNGNWECYEEGPKDPFTNKRNAIRKQSKSKMTAKQKVKETLDALSDGIDSKNADRVTFNQVAQEWLKVYSVTGVKKSTIRQREFAIQNISPYIGHMPINRITHGIMQNLILDLDKRNYSPSHLSGVKVAANFIFKHAIRHRLRMDNPVEDIVMPKKRMTVEEIENEEIPDKYFEREELERFLKAAVEKGLENDVEWFYLMAFTGMRTGEVCALKWSDVDFEGKTVRVTKTLDNPSGNKHKYELTPPKTKRSIRVIELDDEILEILKAHKKRQAKIRLKFRKQYEDYDDGNFVFCREDGYPYYGRLIFRHTVRLCKLAGLSKIEGPHIIRHTYITMLAEAGVDLPTIMQRVGHEDSKTTTKIYTHITKAMKRDATQQVHSHFGNLFKLNQ